MTWVLKDAEREKGIKGRGMELEKTQRWNICLARFWSMLENVFYWSLIFRLKNIAYFTGKGGLWIDCRRECPAHIICGKTQEENSKSFHMLLGTPEQSSR